MAHTTATTKRVLEAIPRARHAAVVAEKNLYVWGGNGQRSNKIDKLDFRNDCYNESTEEIYDLAAMAVTFAGSVAYTFGGFSPSSGSRSNSIHEVDLKTFTVKELTQDATNPPKVRYASSMVLHEDTLIIFGGYTDDGPTKDVLVFDLSTSECE